MNVGWKGRCYLDRVNEVGEGMLVGLNRWGGGYMSHESSEYGGGGGHITWIKRMKGGGGHVCWIKQNWNIVDFNYVFNCKILFCVKYTNMRFECLRIFSFPITKSRKFKIFWEIMYNSIWVLNVIFNYDCVYHRFNLSI